MPADTCGFTTLESLDAFGSLDNLVFSLDSDIWATACVKYGDADVSSTTTVDVSDTIKFRAADANITSSVTVSSDGVRFRLCDGSVSSATTVTADGVRMRLPAASIDCLLDVVCNAGFEASVDATISCLTTVNCQAGGIFEVAGTISNTAVVVTNGRIVGDEWTTVPSGNETWNLYN